MPIRVQTPHGIVEFPDGMSEQDMASALSTLPAPAVSHEPAAPEAPTYPNKLEALFAEQEAAHPLYKKLVQGARSGSVMTGAPTIVGEVAPNLIRGFARRLYGGLLKPKQGLKDSFGDAKQIADTLLEQRAPISAGGLEKVTQRMGDSRTAALKMVQEAEDAGVQGVRPHDVFDEFKPVVSELRKRVDIGQPSELGAVGARGKAILRTMSRAGGDIPPVKAQALKETAQEAASGAYRVMERGGQKQLSAQDLLDTAVASGLKKGLERQVPNVGPQNALTQKLLGGTRALEDAVEREANNNMFGGGRDWAALGAAGLGTATGGPAVGAGAGALMRLLATPSTGSRIAIGINELGKLPIEDATKRALLSLLAEGSHP